MYEQPYETVYCGRKVMLFVSILSFVHAFAKKRGRSDAPPAKTGIFSPKIIQSTMVSFTNSCKTF